MMPGDVDGDLQYLLCLVAVKDSSQTLSIYASVRIDLIKSASNPNGYNPIILDKFMHEIASMAQNNAILLTKDSAGNFTSATLIKAQQTFLAIAYAESKRIQFQNALNVLAQDKNSLAPGKYKTELDEFHRRLQNLANTYFEANVLNHMSANTTLHAFIQGSQDLLADKVGNWQWKLKIAPLVSLIMSIGALLGIVTAQTVHDSKIRYNYLVTASQGAVGQFTLFLANKKRLVAGQSDPVIWPAQLPSIVPPAFLDRMDSVLRRGETDSSAPNSAARSLGAGIDTGEAPWSAYADPDADGNRVNDGPPFTI